MVADACGPLLLLLGVICSVQVTTALKPQDNSLLEGLYKSSGNYCTQVCRQHRTGPAQHMALTKHWCSCAWQKMPGAWDRSGARKQAAHVVFVLAGSRPRACAVKCSCCKQQNACRHEVRLFSSCGCAVLCVCCLACVLLAV